MYTKTLTLLLFAATCFGQAAKLKKTHTFFENMEYPQAVRGYEELLSGGKLTSEDTRTILTNLGLTYKKLHDYRNAERVYKDLFQKYPNKLNASEYLHYAQVLASNSRYRESQKMFSKYGELQTNDLRGGRFTLAYMDNSHFFKDSAMYKIQYMDKLNTRYSDFAPMYYENGLVFVAARNEGTLIKRIFSQNETPFLDLFLYPDSSMTYIPDISDIGELPDGVNPIESVPANRDSAAPPTTEGDFEIEEFSKKLNSKYHEGPVTFSRDFRTVVFTRNNYHNGKAGKNDKNINMLKLYTAEKKEKKWTNVRELPFNSNNYSTGHPAFSPENHRLYFASDMPGGFGGTDIYRVDYMNGEWGVPINLGKEVNTEGDELFPYIDQYGNMYFASDGHAGLGGLDIFYMEMRNGAAFGEAENLGAPINSPKDDFALITDGKRQQGYFSSNRKRGYSDDNIYSFTRGCNTLNIRIYDNDTRQPLAGAEVRLIKNEVNRDQMNTDENGLTAVCLEAGSDFYFKIFKEGYNSSMVTYGTLSSSLSRKQEIAVYLEPTVIPMIKGRVVSEFDRSPIVAAQVILENQEDGTTETVITGLDGRYSFQPSRNGNYSVKAIKENTVAQTTKPAKQKEEELSLLTVGDVLELKNIYYDYGKYEINKSGQKELKEKVLPFLMQYPFVKVELRSHTDSRSSADFNLRLSQRRAEEAKNYLVSLGIQENRIVARGYGKNELLNDCDEYTDCSAAEHRKNRRTEIKILNVAEYSAR